ncbi:MAG: hypothetical protein ACREQ9_11065 [Candidatus Binatia bacterium]
MSMTSEAFCKDKYLRASGYNFYVWAVVNLLVIWPLFDALRGRPWHGLLALLFPIGLIVGGLFLCVLNDNRLEKMCGAANPQPVIEAGAIWGPIFAAGLLFTVVFAVRGPAAYIQPLWLLLIGAAYWIWGGFAVPEFRRLGQVLIVAGAVAGLFIHPAEIDLRLASPAALLIWVVFMSALWIPFGAYINRKYVHALRTEVLPLPIGEGPSEAPVRGSEPQAAPPDRP